MADIRKIPHHVLAALRSAEYTDDQIKLMTAQEVFDAYCDWHGLINWGNVLWNTVLDLQAH